MSGRTYHEIISFGVPWSYKDKQTYVIAHNDTNVTLDEKVELITEDMYRRIFPLKEAEDKDIWLVGGGVLTTMLLNKDVIDEMQIAIVPTILGEGLPLFPGKPKTSKWTLVENKSFSTGLALLTYTKK
ncbi:MAG: dihydrofolate reductase family protein [Bacteroidales bacterium]